MILVIDNYDSFVFNLARYVKELGHEYIVKRNDAVTVDEIQQELKPSHIIISPGPCTPNEAGICLELITKLHNETPILGVCLGHQAIGQAFGGQVRRAIAPTHGKSSTITHDSTGVFAGIQNPLKVGRYHSLIVSSENLPSCLRVTAWSDEQEIMGLQHQNNLLVGVQFHPESVLSDCGHELLANFLVKRS